jgi:hypothetical protein
MKVFCMQKDGHYYHGEKLQFYLQLSQGTQGSPHMSAKGYNIHSIGLGACMTLA